MSESRNHLVGLCAEAVPRVCKPAVPSWLLCVILAIGLPTLAQESPEASTSSSNPAPPDTTDSPAAASLWSRSKLTGTWRGERDQVEAKGLSVTLDATYTFQGVAGGGLDGPLFRQFSDEDDTGSTFSGDLELELDTGKAGPWRGGLIDFELEARVGRSVLRRAGTVSAVNTAATVPNVVDSFDESTLAVTALSFTQSFGKYLALFGGLLNGAEGDENEFAGSSVSTAHFLNSALLSSLVENATSPNVSLGGGVLIEPDPNISGSVSVFGTEETAGENPFTHTDGTTFSTEWTVAHELLQRGGAQTFGFLYGIDATRTAIGADPRLVIDGSLMGQPLPTTTDDTWSLYYNAHQYMEGDAAGGWGAFVRLGVSDGDPNPVKWNMAAGLGGTGLLPQRRQDTWGLGSFYLGMSNQDLLKDLNVGDEVGGELYYNVAITPWFHATLDGQVIDSALPRAGTAWILGLRTHVDF